jgi:tripartite-type tricarboxylate transporter receptor subunit TctC
MPTFAKNLLRCLCAAFCFEMLGLGPASADDFYKGRTITFIIGTAPGGGYDTYSRLLASHLGAQLAGGPTIVPQNMPGAAGIRAENYLYNLAPRDGTVIGMLDEALYLNQILGTQEIKADAGKFSWIGRLLANSAVLFARRDAAVQKIQDAFDKELIVSATGTASKLNWTVLKNALGMKLKIISGYQGTNESLLALVRGEAEALSMPWSILRITGAQLLADRQINLLLQTGAEKDPGLPDLPRMIDLARNEEERQLLALFSSPSLIGRSVLAPPGTSPERVAELRRAFMATLRDARFLDDLAKARLELTPLPGEALQAAVARMGEFPEPLIERARRVSDMVRN